LKWGFDYSTAAAVAFFCLDTKETKDQVSRYASSPHEACPAKAVKRGPGKFAPYPLLPSLLQYFPLCPPLRTSPTSVFHFSAEATLLTARKTCLCWSALVVGRPALFFAFLNFFVMLPVEASIIKAHVQRNDLENAPFDKLRVTRFCNIEHRMLNIEY
jgi:hypothetical protein